MGSLGFNPSSEHLPVPADDSQKIVEVVRHPSGQPSHRLHLLRAPELLFQFMPFGDVMQHCDRAGEISAIVEQRVHRDMKPAPAHENVFRFVPQAFARALE